MVEALACRRAVQFAVEIGLHDVIFEGDAAVVINAISKGLANQSLYGHLVDDILGQASHLHFSEFCFVPRSCNAVAAALAKRAKIPLVKNSSLMASSFRCLFLFFHVGFQIR